MYTRRGLGPVLFLFAICMALVAFVGVAGASYPPPKLAGIVGVPLITDPLHHISGVVAVPPSKMRARSQASSRFDGGLTPPLFGPNVDASLNDPSAQNETTIAINPEDDQRVIAAANDYRLSL